MLIVKRIISKFLKRYEVKRILSEDNTVFLTFDDGPENSITEFVLDELDKYGFKATFFCRGDNAEKNIRLLELIKEKGHSIGNHTYSHIHAYTVSTSDYVKDVEQAETILNTPLFRPPWGSLTIGVFFYLKKKYKIIYWSLDSEDVGLNSFNYQQSLEKLKNNTKKGDIVLFHCCHRHEKETRILLPSYLEWLKENSFISKGIESKI